MLKSARRCLLLATVVVISGAAVGCSGSSLWSINRFLANTGYDDGTDDSEAWVEDAASEGRSGRAVEKQADPLGLRNVFMSDKARAIERNVGIE